jgi:hypothetical protein
MSLRPHFVCAFATLALTTLCPARADDVGTVKEKLFQAKKEYDAEVQKFRKSVGDALDKREADARKAGNKKLVEQIKDDRDRFEKSGELPTDGSKAALTQITAARAKLDKAYTAAVKDLVKIKEDAAAEATEKEQQKFQLEAALLFGKRTYLVALKHNDLKDEKNWFTDNGTQTGTGIKIKRDGQPVPHSVHMYPPGKGAAEIHYLLAGKWTALRTSVGVPKIEDNAEPPASQLAFEVVGDGKSLWKSEPVTKLDTFQTCELNVTKIKILTLLVHCPGENHWARAFWFEPILAE